MTFLKFFIDLLSNRLLITIIFTAIVAQIIKTVVVSVRHKKFDLSLAGTTGGMPSSHTAVVISLLTGVYYDQGITSLLVVVGVFAGIVMHDAVTLRREMGFQSKVLNKMIKKLHVKHQKKLKELLGHNVPEVIIGAILGYILGFAVYHL